MAKEIFKEKQRFRDWEVLGLLAFFIIALTYKFIDQQWIHPVSNSMSIIAYLLLLLPLAGGLWYLLSLRLSVKVTDKYISLKYSPLHTRKQKILWEEIEECEILKPLSRAVLSGWNISFNHEKKFTLSGRTGLHLKTKGGEEIIIGARKCNELERAVRRYFPRENAS